MFSLSYYKFVCLHRNKLWIHEKSLCRVVHTWLFLHCKERKIHSWRWTQTLPDWSPTWQRRDELVNVPYVPLPRITGQEAMVQQWQLRALCHRQALGNWHGGRGSFVEGQIWTLIWILLCRVDWVSSRQSSSRPLNTGSSLRESERKMGLYWGFSLIYRCNTSVWFKKKKKRKREKTYIYTYIHT